MGVSKMDMNGFIGRLKNLRGISKFFLAVVAILCLTFCGHDASDTQETLKTVKIKIHAWAGYAQEYETQFKEYTRHSRKIDVKLDITHATGLESFIKAIQENGVHLISPANDLLEPLHRQKLIQALDIKRIPKFNQINPIIRTTKAYEIDGQVYAVPFNFGPYAIAYNKDKVETPKSYKVLWDRKYSKRVTIPALYDTINIYMAALMLDMPKKDLFNLSDEQLGRVEEALRVLCKDQVAEFWDENLVPEHHDRFDLGMDWGIGVAQINKKYGGNWGYTIPAEGATGWIDTWAVTVNVKDKDVQEVVYEWLDFMISPKIQAQVARVTSYGPVNPYAGRYLSAKEKDQYYLTDPDFLNKITLWQPLRPEVLTRYQETWRRAKN